LRGQHEYRSLNLAIGQIFPVLLAAFYENDILPFSPRSPNIFWAVNKILNNKFYAFFSTLSIPIFYRIPHIMLMTLSLYCTVIILRASYLLCIFGLFMYMYFLPNVLLIKSSPACTISPCITVMVKSIATVMVGGGLYLLLLQSVSYL
jgi:hypothetical protein